METKRCFPWEFCQNLEILFNPSSSRSLSYHIYTLWLFTFSDLKTIVGPKTAFGILSAISGPVLTTDSSPNALAILRRLPIVAFWAWINLLPFTIDNQRQPKSVQEDSANKSWRPMPSERISSAEAKYLMFAFYSAAFFVSLLIGGSKQCVALMLLGYWYNDLRGSDESCIVRNLINGFGFICYASGATEIALGHGPAMLNQTAYLWFSIIGLIVFTTVQTQDMSDQAGDSLRGRKTVPLVVGDKRARWTIAVPIAMWSFACPLFWRFGPGGYVVPGTIGAVIVFRTLSKTSVEDDKITFRIWNLWMVWLYLLPLVRRYTIT